MDKNEIKRANRKALPQFMLIMVICFIIGGTIGFCSAKYGLNTLAGGMKTAGMFFGTYIAPWLMLAAAVIGCFLFLLCFFFFFVFCAGGLRSYLSKRNKTTCILGRRK